MSRKASNADNRAPTVIGALAFLTWAAFVAGLVYLWDPPPRPRYDGSWEFSRVATVVFVCLQGSLLIILGGLLSCSMAIAHACLSRGRLRWVFIALNLITLAVLYCLVPLTLSP